LIFSIINSLISYFLKVRNFRDRRYEFKKLTKTWKKSKEKAKGNGDAIGARSASDKETLYDSLQVLECIRGEEKRETCALK